MVDLFSNLWSSANTLFTIAGIVISIIWGVFSIRKLIQERGENMEKRILSGIRTEMSAHLEPIKTAVDKNEQLFLTDKTEKERLILTLKDDIHVLEKHLQDLCNSVSKHDGILESVSPTIIAVQNQITELKIKVEVMEKGMITSAFTKEDTK